MAAANPLSRALGNAHAAACMRLRRVGLTGSALEVADSEAEASPLSYALGNAWEGTGSCTASGQMGSALGAAGSGAAAVPLRLRAGIGMRLRAAALRRAT